MVKLLLILIMSAVTATALGLAAVVTRQPTVSTVKMANNANEITGARR